MSTPGANILHWICNPLDAEDVTVLRRVKAGTQSFYANRLSVAYLVARECVFADLEACKLSVTEKGEDALDHYRSR
jgi:hypothetical protein